MAERYNTNNPRPSNSMKDLNDNALAYDDFINSDADTAMDRFSNPFPTVRRQVAVRIDELVGASQNAIESAEIAKAAAEEAKVAASAAEGGVAVLRSELAADDGSQLSGFKVRTVFDRLSDTVSVLDYGTSLMSLSQKLQLAFNDLNARNGGDILIPAGFYSWGTTTVTATLNKPIGLIYDSAAIISVTTPLAMFDINVNQKIFTSRGAGTILSNWGAASGEGAIVYKLKDYTLKRSAIISDLQIYRADSSIFEYGVKGTLINDSEFFKLHFNVQNGIYIDNAGSIASVAHCMTHTFNTCKFYNGVNGITLSNSTYPGIEGCKLITCDLLATRGLRYLWTTAPTYLPPQLAVIGCHFNSKYPVEIQAASQVSLIGNTVYVNTTAADIADAVVVLRGVESFQIVGNNFSPIGARTDATTPSCIMLDSFTGASSVYPTAHGDIGNNTWWAEYSTKPCIDATSTTSFTSVTDRGNTWRTDNSGTRLSTTARGVALIAGQGLRNSEATLGFGSAAISGGTLTLTNTNNISSMFNVGSATTITSIISSLIGRVINVTFPAGTVLTHSTNLQLAEQRNYTVRTTDATLSFYVINNAQVKQVATPTLRLSQQVSTAPATPTSSGVQGDYYYDSSYLYICVATNLWRRSAIGAW